MLASVVDHVIARLTNPGDIVLDPFAGFGTTLARAAALGRQAAGVELLPERVQHIRAHTPAARVVEGDARELLRLVRPQAVGGDAILAPDTPVDLVLTSPPYMTVTHHEADPLTAYERNGGDYDRYLAEMSVVVAQCARLLKRGGYLVCNVADIFYEDHMTHLIGDYDEVMRRHLDPAGMTEIVWDSLPHDLVRDALLVYRRR
ncbi:MAG: site-specific DNA-methyltransferase [Leucobacter sp.]|nr:site-specific DNA-methyltransferase [Leucobacter sp.]